MSKKLHIILMAVALLCSFALIAQDKQMTISGKIVDAQGAPLPSATVRIQNTTKGTAADINGKYTLKVSKGDTIEVLFMGFKTATAKITGERTVYDFTLEEDSNMLEEVVMIGYGSVKKQDLTGSVTNVKMQDIQSAPVLSVDNALQGRIAGADFMSTDGAPGSTTTIRIRGTRSITASNEPLFVVDGIIDAIHDLNDINSDDIASISVLKDASSTVIYGSRGANGVIIITTKKGTGRKGQTGITFKADVGFAQLPRKLDIMNASEFQMYRNEVASFGADANHTGMGLDTPLSELVYHDPYHVTESTDWIEEITRTAITQNYALTLNGSENKHNYYASFSYNDTQGIIQGSGQKRMTGRINLDRRIFKWLKVGYNGSYPTTTRTRQPSAAPPGTRAPCT